MSQQPPFGGINQTSLFGYMNPQESFRDNVLAAMSYFNGRCKLDTFLAFYCSKYKSFQDDVLRKLRMHTDLINVYYDEIFVTPPFQGFLPHHNAPSQSSKAVSQNQGAPSSDNSFQDKGAQRNSDDEDTQKEKRLDSKFSGFIPLSGSFSDPSKAKALTAPFTRYGLQPQPSNTPVSGLAANLPSRSQSTPQWPIAGSAANLSSSLASNMNEVLSTMAKSTRTATLGVATLSARGATCSSTNSMISSAISERISMAGFQPSPSSIGPPPGTKIRNNYHKEMVFRPIHMPRYTRLSADLVNAQIKECIDIFSEANEHASLGRLSQTIVTKFRVNQISDLSLTEDQFVNLPAYRQHAQMLSQINSYIHCFVWSRSLCTLYELQLCLRDFHENRDFESLRLGPLQKLPLIYQYFRFPWDEYIPAITTLDVIQQLDCFLDQRQLWSTNFDSDMFMDHLKVNYKTYNCNSLGVKMRSLPLAIKMLKKAKRDAAAQRRDILKAVADQTNQDIFKAFELYKASILQAGKDGNELRLHYIKLPPEVAIPEVMEKFEQLANIFSQSKKTRKALRCYHQFVKSILEVPLLKQLFHLSVCLSKLDLEETASALFEAESNDEKEESQKKQQLVTKKNTPSKGSLKEKILHYLNKCMEQGSIKLSHLERIETRVLEDVDVSSFSDMGYGTFLEFIHTEETIKKVFEESGETLFGFYNDHDSIYKPSLLELSEFLWQAKLSGVSQIEVLETSLKEQYQVSKVDHLGHGKMARLCSAAEKPGKHASDAYSLYYEAALCNKSCPSTIFEGTGIQGDVSKETAFFCLTACPLLEDLAEWSQWSLVFQPQYGNLKDFIKKYGGVKKINLDGGTKVGICDIKALEVAPGKLLKVSACPTINKFWDALHKGNPYEAAGQLASLVVFHKGLESAPMALMHDYMERKLLMLYASNLSDPTTEDDTTSKKCVNMAVQFVATMLLRLPVRICVAVANLVLLEPLSRLIGAATYKREIKNACPLPAERRQLELLGCLLGISEWSETIQNRFQLPDDCIEICQTLCPPSKDEDAAIEGLFDESVDYDEDDEDEDDDSSYEFDDMLGEKDLEEDESEASSKKEEVSKGNESSSDVQQTSEESTMSEDVAASASSEKKVETVKELSSDIAAEITVKPSNDSHLANMKARDNLEMDQVVDKMTCAETEERELTQEEKCQLIVEDIRREEFGVGVVLDETGQKLMLKQQERQGRSLQRLSKDLYSKETHFVLELIQNADDNNYSEGVNPSIMFVIDHTGVKVLNNEQGFEEKNIRAICDVGKSTKSKHTYGYIGQKGIGFKSVFRVTSCPEVHSNGFHIYFDVNSGPMGYILPHWKEDYRSHENWQTQIILPWTEDIKQQVGTHAARFNDIQPSLLLFLHRLKQITIVNKVEGSGISMRRQDFDNGEVQISHSHGVDRWLVLRKILDASNISLQVKSGIEVESTEIALAFPLKAKQFIMSAQKKPEKLPVFAFLPLRSYGFRFVVQGDFDVPSSREDVDRDSFWNQWIRNEIHVLFIEALETFKAREDLTPVEAIIQYLQFVPLEGEVMGFFKPVATQILDQLKAKECMPVLNVDTKTIQWQMPSKTIITHDALVLEVVSHEVLHQHLDLNYLHPEVAAVISEPLTRSLGIESITTEHLLQIGRSIAHHWEQTGTITFIAKWLACVRRSLDDFQDNKETLVQLRNMKIVPLSCGSLVSLSNVTVFMLADNPAQMTSAGTKDGQEGAHPLLNLRKDLNILHSGLISTADNEVNSQVVKLLLSLGIKQLTPHDLIYSHILPVFKSEAWKEKNPEVLMSYVVYIKSELDKNLSVVDKEELAVVKLLTNHGIKSPTDYVHFPKDFGNKFDLESNFPGLDWTLVDPGYLPVPLNPQDRHSWHRFLSQLGVTDFFKVTKEELVFEKSNMHETVWSAMKEIWPESPDGYAVTDFQCEEFHRLVTMANKQPEKLIPQMAKLFEFLDVLWDQEYYKFVHTQLRSGSGHVLKEIIPTTFAMHLQWIPWVKALNSISRFNEANRTVDILQTESLELPSNLYLRDQSIERFLHHTVKYLNVLSQPGSKFVQFLNIKSSLSLDNVKSALISWGSRNKNFPEKPAIFCSTLWNMQEIYTYLSDEMRPKDCQDLFHLEPVIFVPMHDQHCRGGGVRAGWMMRREEVCWSDPTVLVSKYRRTLDMYSSPLSKLKLLKDTYSHMEEMFSRAVRPEKEPSTIQYAQLLEHIATVFSLSEVGVLSDALILFCKIGKDLSQISKTAAEVKTNEALRAEANLPKVKELLSKAAVFPTKLGQWVRLSDSPMLSDSKELEEMFINERSVHLLATELSHPALFLQGAGNFDAEGVKYLISLLPDIKPLSESVTLKEIIPGFQQCNKGQTYLHNVVGLVQRFLYHSFPQVYSVFKSRKSAFLKDLIFSQVEELQVRYELTFKPEVFKIRDEKCVVRDNCLYFHINYVDSHTEINKELAKYFSEGDEKCMRELRSFLAQAHLILEAKLDETIDDLFHRLLPEGSTLPPGEEVWRVPLPIISGQMPKPKMETFEEPPSAPESHIPVKKQETQRKAHTCWPPRFGGDIKEGGVITTDPTKYGATHRPAFLGTASSKTHQKMPRCSAKFLDEAGNIIAMTRLGAPYPSRLPLHATEGGSAQPIGGLVSSYETYTASDGAMMVHPEASATDGGNDDNSCSGETRKRKMVDDPSKEDFMAFKKRTSDALTQVDAGQMETANLESVRGENISRDQILSSSLISQEGKRSGRHKSMLHFTVPSWNESNQDLVYSELACAESLTLPTMEIDAEAQDTEVGQWGEQLVSDYLQRQKQVNRNILSIAWMNAAGEKGLPFDFEILLRDDDLDTQKTVYIEVKSTQSWDKEIFHISSKQLEFALTHKDRYEIYRVYGAGSLRARLVRIENVAEKLNVKQIRLFMII